MSRRLSIRIQLFALVLAIAAPLTGALVYVAVHAYRTSQRQAEGEIRNLAATTAMNLAAAIAENRRLLGVLAQRPLVQLLDPKRCDPFLQGFLELHPEYVNLVVRNLRGESVCAYLPNPTPAHIAADFPWIREAVRSRRFTAGDAHLGRDSGRWVTVLTLPLIDARSAVVGTLGLPLDLQRLQAQILPAVLPDVVVSVIDRRGHFLVRSAEPGRWIGKSVANPANMLRLRRAGEGMFRVTSVDGAPRIYAYRTDPGTGWVVTAGIAEAALLAPMRREIEQALAVVLITLLAAILLARRFGAGILKPIGGLAATADKVAAGDLAARASLDGPAEIATVAQVFNGMLEVRERSDAQLRLLNRTFAVLSGCNAALVRATGEQELLDEMCRIVVERGDHALAWVGIAEQDEGRRVRPVAMFGATGYLDEIEVSWGEGELGGGPAGTAIRTGRPAVLRDARSDERFDPWRDRARSFGLRSSVGLPLGREVPAFGLLNIYSGDPARFDEEEVRLLMELASDMAFGIQLLRGDARRREAELALRESEERFRQIATNVSEVFWLSDPVKNTMLYVSPAYERVWQRSAADLYRQPRQWLEAMHPEDRARVLDAATAKQRDGSYDEEYRILRPDGSVRWIRDRAFPVRGASGEVIRLAGVAQDITERKLAEMRIGNLNRIYAILSQINALIVRVRGREELFRGACRIAVEGGGFRMAWIGVVDEAAATVHPVAWDGEVGDFFATAPQAVTDLRPGSPSLSGVAIREMKAAIVNDVHSDPRILAQREFESRGIHSLCIIPLRVDGEAAGVLALYAPVKDFFDEQEMALLAELAGDISFALEHIGRSEALDYIAYYDVLTGLANRTLFHERLAQRLKRSGTEQAQAGLVLLDVERFKAVNDSHGRQAGDELLRQIARRLVDAVQDPDDVARVGSDVFAVLLPWFGHASHLVRMLEEQFRRCFAEPFEVGGDTALRMSARTGVALFPQDGTDPETLYSNAEAALKKAKAGSERLLFYQHGMTEERVEKLSLENKLRLALERDEMVLYYQPKVEVGTRRICGVEALIRWRSPELGLVPPLRFIPLLEETGLILEAGTWALRRARPSTIAAGSSRGSRHRASRSTSRRSSCAGRSSWPWCRPR